MSRSYRQSSVYAPDSNKEFKLRSHRLMRRLVRQDLYDCEDFDSLVLPEMLEISRFRDSPKDGYCTFFGAERDPELRKLLRK